MNNKQSQQNSVTVHFNARHYWEESLEVQLIWPKMGRAREQKLYSQTARLRRREMKTYSFEIS